MPGVCGNFPSANVLDYGAGLSHERAENYVMMCGATRYTWYDPYWNDDAGNAKAFMNAPYDIILCANCLNVINDDKAMYDAVYNMLSLLKRGQDGFGYIFLTVYEGDKSGVGKVTRDGYQRNLKTGEYVRLLYNELNAGYGDGKEHIKVNRLGRAIMLRYATPCELCDLYDERFCRLCSDVGGMYAQPYYDASEYVVKNHFYMSDVTRLTDFGNTFENRKYAFRLYHAWNYCKDMTCKDCPEKVKGNCPYGEIANAFLQVRNHTLGIPDED